MFRRYYITGATGFLGGTVVRRLVKDGAQVRALVRQGSRLERLLPATVERAYGSVNDMGSLEAFLADAGEGDCVIHCAGVISIASKPDAALRRVNVDGTRNIVNKCMQKHIGKLIYVSSVHAIPEKPHGEQMSEVSDFSPETVSGAYARTKAEATACVLSAAECGLNASVVHPSGIIGPEDNGSGSITGMIRSYIVGRLPAGVKGGYDFVDVRDVAEGIISCCENGKAGECYILSNRLVSVRELLETLKKVTGGKRILAYVPIWMAKLAAPICERVSLKNKTPLFFTPYAIETLNTNANFSHEKATRELNYRPRPLAQTLADTARWLKTNAHMK